MRFWWTLNNFQKSSHFNIFSLIDGWNKIISNITYVSWLHWLTQTQIKIQSNWALKVPFLHSVVLQHTNSLKFTRFLYVGPSNSVRMWILWQLGSSFFSRFMGITQVDWVGRQKRWRQWNKKILQYNKLSIFEKSIGIELVFRFWIIEHTSEKLIMSFFNYSEKPKNSIQWG